MTSRRYDINANVKDAINQITQDIRHLTTSESTHYRADKAEEIVRFARALETLTLHQHNLALDPTLAENEEYMRMATNAYTIDLSDWSEPLRMETLIHTPTKKIRKKLTTKYGHQVKCMQVTGYNTETRTHELTFTLNDGTTHTIYTYGDSRETAILENLRLTNRQLAPHTCFTTRKTRYPTALILTIRTTLQ